MAVEAEISSVLAKLFWSLDHQQAQPVESCWSEAGRLQIWPFEGDPVLLQGRASIMAYCQQFWTGTASPMRHLLAAVTIDKATAQCASARFYCHYIRVGEEPVIVGMGEYRNQFMHKEGSWKIVDSELRFLAPLV